MKDLVLGLILVFGVLIWLGFPPASLFVGLGVGIVLRLLVKLVLYAFKPYDFNGKVKHED